MHIETTSERWICMKTIKIPYYTSSLDLHIGEENLEAVITAKTDEYVAGKSEAQLVEEALANAIGVEDDDIKWNDTAKSIILEKDDRKIEVYIGSDKLLINGLEVKMNTEAVIKNSRTYLPLRSICEAFGRSNIVWDGATKTVMIGK